MLALSLSERASRQRIAPNGLLSMQMAHHARKRFDLFAFIGTRDSPSFFLFDSLGGRGEKRGVRHVVLTFAS